MIIDAFTYNGESDILDFRINLLSEYVDIFIAIEGTHTFSGISKDLGTISNHPKLKFNLFKPEIGKLNFDNKPTTYDPSHDCWKIEYQQRNAIMEACKEFSDDDIIIMGDVDEIPSIEAINYAKNNLLPLVCSQAFFYYNLKHLRSEIWNGSAITTMRHLREATPQGLRNMRHQLQSIRPAGWHLSWFGDIKEKIEAFSHQELNIPKFKDAAHIERCKATGADLFNRGTQTIAVDRSFFPPYFLVHAPSEWF